MKIVEDAKWFSKQFNHLKFPTELYKHCKRIDGLEIGRLYETPEGKTYPSVTSILAVQEKPELEHWKELVGEEEAKSVSLRATTNGTYVHDLAEKYIKNSVDDWKTENPLVKNKFQPLKKILDEHVDNIFASELKFYSDKLRVAGTTDLIAEYDGVLSVIDYKTSKRIKYNDEIKDYFIQGSVYAMMAFEMFNLPIKDIVILMIVENDILVFKEKVKNHLKDYVIIRRLFKEKYNI